MAITLVCWGCGSHLQNSDTNFQMSDISGNNEDRNLMLVSISMFSGSEKPNMINIMFLVVVSAVVYSIG